MRISIQLEAVAATEQSDAQKAYREFFLARLETFGVSSPSSLTEDVKSKFFGGITEAWDKYKEQNDIRTKDEV